MSGSKFRDPLIGQHHASVRGELPPKQGRAHRWVAIVSYALTQGQAVSAHEGNAVNLDEKNRLSVVVGCWDCEQEYPAGHRDCDTYAPSS